MLRIILKASKLRDANMWMLTRTAIGREYGGEELADVHLRSAGVIEADGHYFRRENLPQAIAVLRFHGFEVEVEE